MRTDKITEQQLRGWLLHLKLKKQHAYGTLRVALSGVKFFFAHTCPRDWQSLDKIKLQNVKTLPEVLTIGQTAFGHPPRDWPAVRALSFDTVTTG